jgi:hypothetical protein
VTVLLLPPGIHDTVLSGSTRVPSVLVNPELQAPVEPPETTVTVTVEVCCTTTTGGGGSVTSVCPPAGCQTKLVVISPVHEAGELPPELPL